jgi:hypothetical protein
VALPGLVRVAFVASLLGLDRRTCRDHLQRAGCQPIRRPRAAATDRDGPWYVSVEDSLRLIDWMLPRSVQVAANRRARQRLRMEARLTGSSGQLVRYREPTRSGGTGEEEP